MVSAPFGVLRTVARVLRALVLCLSMAGMLVSQARAQALVAPDNPPAKIVKAEVQAHKANGYGRIILSFSDPVVSEVRMSGGVLVIAFKTPVDFAPERLQSDLSGYVSAVRKDPDGKGVRLALSQQVTVNQMEAGERLFVDLLPLSWKGDPPPLPMEVVEELTKRARDAERKARILEKLNSGKMLPPVTVRIGNNPTFTRFVFGLPEPVNVQIERANDRLTLHIGKPFPIDLRQAKAALPHFIGQIDAEQNEDHLVVKLIMAPATDVRAFREDQSYVVDVSMREQKKGEIGTLGEQQRGPLISESAQVTRLPSETDAAGAPVPVAAKAGSHAPAGGGSEDHGKPVAAPANQGTSAPVEGDHGSSTHAASEGAIRTVPAAGAVAQRPVEPIAPRKVEAPASNAKLAEPSLPVRVADAVQAPAATPPGEASARPADSAANSAEAPASQPVVNAAPAEPEAKPEQAAEAPAKPSQTLAAKPQLDMAGPKSESKPAAAFNAPPPPIPALVAAPAPVQRADASAKTAKLPVNMSRRGENVRLLFPFDQDVPAAIFIRGDTLWAVFETDRDFDSSALQAMNGGQFRFSAVSRTPGGIVLRLGIEPWVQAFANRDGTAWIVNLGPALLEPPRPLSFQRLTGSDGKSLMTADFEKPGRAFRLRDPLVGDDLFIATAYPPMRSFLRTQDYVEMTALAGAQGLIIVPKADDVQAEVIKERVIVSRPDGLTLSSNSGIPSIAQRGVRRSRATNFDPQMWAFDRSAPFRSREADLIFFAAMAHESQRQAARLDLARFYIAREFYPEAKAVVDAIIRADSRTAEDGSLQGLRGILNIMLERPDQAVKDLAHPGVQGTQDAGLWRAVAQQQLGQYSNAQEGFRNYGALIPTLPEALQRKVLFSAADTALNVNDVTGATSRLKEIEHIGVPLEAEQALTLLAGRLAELEGRPDDAAIRYAGAGNGQTMTPAKADADLRLIQLHLKSGKLSKKEAIEALERQSYSWRGDDIEARLLETLGKLYVDVENYRAAFSLLRTSLLAHPRSPSTTVLQDVMVKSFEALFLEGKADKLNPVDALALFYDFRDLTPQGHKGDEIVRRLADRLVNLDLLDQAASLLKYQVENRLTGAARSQVAARLAVIHLMNRHPQLAIDTLRATRMADLPEALRQQRYLLEARALAETSRNDLALELLDEVKTHESDLLHSDILWSAQRTGEAAEYSERVVENHRKTLKGDEDDRRLMMRAAIGYALENDTMSLNRVRAKYKSMMEGTTEERAFDIITSPIEARGVAYREIAHSLADRDTLDNFLKNYRQRYPTEMPGSTQRNGGAQAPKS